MEYALLRSLRALGPGLILLGYFDLFLLLVLDRAPIFWQLDSAKLLLSGYVVGGVYGVFASFLKRDRHAFGGVNQSILDNLQKFFPEVRGLKWEEVSPCYYNLIDNDRSLEQKSKGLYFNGFVVTTSFDAVWISLLASVLGGVSVLCMGRWQYLVLALAVCASSYVVWRISVRRHQDLSAGQVNVIGRRLATDFRACLLPFRESRG